MKTKKYIIISMANILTVRGIGGVMRILGISLRKNELYYAVIEGAKKSESNLIELRKTNIRDTESTPELMNWFDSNFRELIEKFKPDHVTYKLHLNTNKDQMAYLQFPMGVLNLICCTEKIEITARSTSYITNERKRIAQNYFKDFKDKFKDSELDALAVALSVMEE